LAPGPERVSIRGMARKLLAGVALAAALGCVGPASADQVQILRSAKVVRLHPVLKIAVADLRPLALLVARRGAVDGNGALLEKNIRAEDTIEVASSSNGGSVVRWRSPKRLRQGTWFVQVTALETDGAPACPPAESNCNERWSNVRRVIVRKAS
jgi:hypothetical protein